MAPRLFTTFEIGSTLIAFVLDCDLSVAATAQTDINQNKSTAPVFYIGVNRLYRSHRRSAFSIWVIE
jgi:hypothetical protein